MNIQVIRASLIGAVFALLAACSGSSGGKTGELRIGLTDGPVEKADKVVVAFTGIQLKAAGSDEPMEPVAPDPDACDTWDPVDEVCEIDLLQLTGETRRVVFSGALDAGEYEWIRLLVNAERDVIDSYVDIEGMTCPLWIPSGNRSGLKIVSGITVTANGESDYTLDFDVRKSITAPPGLAAGASTMELCLQNYVGKPAIRIVDTTETATVDGTVAATTLAADAACAMNDTTGQYENVAAYIFENTDGLSVADDIDGVDEDADGMDGDLVGRDPVTTASVVYDVDLDTYVYEAGYLLTGEDYFVGIACSTDVDLLETNDLDLTSEEPQPFGFVAVSTTQTLGKEGLTIPF